MTNKSILIILIIVSIVFTTCKKHNDDDIGGNTETNYYKQNPPKSGDVYIVGHEGRYAVTWKNGEFFASTNAEKIGKTNSIYISGSDVYEVGSSGSETSGQYGILWKNGVPDEKSYSNNLTSVFVWNNNVYVEGGGVWKNGEQIINDAANSVYVFRGNVYAAGTIITYHYYGDARLWENNTIQGLGIEGSFSNDCPTKANSVFVSESGNVYVAGIVSTYIVDYEHQYSGNGPRAGVWENGIAQSFTNGLEATSVYVSGNDVYVAGFKCNNNNVNLKRATLWKNGVEQELSDKTSVANCVFVVGSDVYVVGSETTGSNRNRAVLWKNGVTQYLTDGAVDASAISVFVVE
jgi:hypothetical protein